MLDIENIVKMDSEIEKFLEEYRRNASLPVILYGAGAGVQWFVEFLKKYNVPVECIVDKKIRKGQREHLGEILLRNVDDVWEEYDEVLVIISAPRYRHEISESIKSKKPLYHIFAFDPLLEVIQDITCGERKQYYMRHKQELEELWNILEDDFSKKTLEYVLKGAVTSDCDYYPEISNESQYFSDIMRKALSEEEVFVDIGAFTGDSLEAFVEVTENTFEKCYAFEPDSDNYVALQTAYQADSRIIMHKKGLGSENKVMYFRSDAGSSSVVEEENTATTKIEVTRLDDVIKDRVTLIKMDIEGMEMEALKGGEELIKKYKPKLAICVYHKVEDPIEISKYIQGLNLGYKLYLRHYWDCTGTDTVLFAI